MNSILFWSAYVAHWALIAGWFACHWAISDARRRTCRPRQVVETEPATVTVIVPARNEAANIQCCAAQILEQRSVALSLVVVNDRSHDATPDIADEIARQDARCRVIHNTDLPDGWMGKSHACWRGAAEARGDWLLFTDADVRLEPLALASAVEFASKRNFDLFSLWLRDGSVGFWEKTLIPLCGAMIVIWYGHVAAHSNAAGDAFANGQFLLVRRRVYETLGGHAAVRTALIEDIPLARLAAKKGYRVGSAPGPEIGCVRMYRGLREVVQGWTRIFVGVLSPVQMGGCLISLLVGSVLPLVLTPVLCWHVSRAGFSLWPTLWLISSTAQLIVLTSVSIRFFSLARCDLRHLVFYPISVAGVIGILLAAIFKRCAHSTVSWRGNHYRLAHGGTIAGSAKAKSAERAAPSMKSLK